MLRNAAGNAFAWWVMGIAAVLLVICLALYGIRFPNLSDCPDDWAAFGSYLAGVSALIVGFATILLLLHNVRLLREQVDVSVAHAEKQERLIAQQAAALRAESLMERSVRTERAIERVFVSIEGMAAEADSAWEAFDVAVGRYAKRGDAFSDVPLKQHHEALRALWPNRIKYPALVKLSGLLGELQQRVSEAESGGFVSEYWAAWIAGALPETALRFLYYQSWLAPHEPLSTWVRSQAILRYVTPDILLRPEDAREDIPLPYPVPERGASPEGGAA